MFFRAPCAFWSYRGRQGRNICLSSLPLLSPFLLVSSSSSRRRHRRLHLEGFAAVLEESWRAHVRPESLLGENHDDDIAACTLLGGEACQEKTRQASLLSLEVAMVLSLFL